MIAPITPQGLSLYSLLAGFIPTDCLDRLAVVSLCGVVIAFMTVALWGFSRTSSAADTPPLAK